MANHSTERIKILSKSGKILQTEIKSILDQIKINSVDLHSDPVALLDESGFIVDILYTARRSGASVLFEPEYLARYSTWKINSDEGCASDTIANSANYYENALYQFDEIRFIGPCEKTKEFALGLLHNYKKENIIEENIISYDLNGVYHSNNYRRNYDDGKTKLEIVNRNRFIELQNGEIKNIMFSEGVDFVEKFLKVAYGYPTRIDKHLDGIEFCYKGRKTHSIYWRKTTKENGNWEHLTADWWDNCINCMWVEFRTKYELQMRANMRL